MVENKNKKRFDMVDKRRNIDHDGPITIAEIIDQINLEQVYMEDDMKTIEVKSSEINRPVLQLSGFFKYFSEGRIQVIGKSERSYFSLKSDEEKKENLRKYFALDFPALIFAHGTEPSQLFLDMAKEYHKPILKTPRSTTRIINMLAYYLDTRMAPSITIHGVLVEVFGIGILIKGDSGIGKSETALDLVQRGHRLVADDSVKISAVDENVLTGTAPELLRFFMEIRGIGIVDIKAMYGTGAIRYRKTVDLIVYLEEWDEKKYYDRVGDEREYEKILGVDLQKITIPVKPGRNLAMIIEVAAMNYRQHQTGYDSAEIFTKRLQETIKNNKE